MNVLNVGFFSFVTTKSLRIKDGRDRQGAIASRETHSKSIHLLYRLGMVDNNRLKNWNILYSDGFVDASVANCGIKRDFIYDMSYDLGYN